MNEAKGWEPFYFRILGEYLKYGFKDSYTTKGTLENSATTEEQKLSISLKLIFHAY